MGQDEAISFTNGADEFFRLDHIKKWSEKIISNLAKTVPHDVERSGKYKDAAIRKQRAIFSELLQYFSSDRIKVRKIHAILANLQYDPDNRDVFDFHYQAALNSTPEWGEGYTEWASVLESDGSSTVRRKAIEILKQGLEQPLLEEGEWMRIRILERLIHRCTKERRTENLDEYRKQLIELRLAESRR